MSFKREVLYQKWRPKNFSDVMGQDHITTTLKNSLLKDRNAHAYLLAMFPRPIIPQLIVDI